jgi:hypothetical protein
MKQPNKNNKIHNNNNKKRWWPRRLLTQGKGDIKRGEKRIWNKKRLLGGELLVTTKEENDDHKSCHCEGKDVEWNLVGTIVEGTMIHVQDIYQYYTKQFSFDFFL